jgi:hypothetical protein
MSPKFIVLSWSWEIFKAGVALPGRVDTWRAGPARQDPIGSTDTSRHVGKTPHPAWQRKSILPNPTLSRLPPSRATAAAYEGPLPVSPPAPPAKKKLLCRPPAQHRRGLARFLPPLPQIAVGHVEERPTPPARCSVVCLAGGYGQQR